MSMTKNKDGTLPSASDFLKYMLVATVIIVISFLFPKSIDTLDFKIGERWEMNDIVATEDVPILKSEGEVKEEKKAIEDTFTPYFIRDNEVASRNIDALKEKISTLEMDNLVDRTQQVDVVMVRKLDSLYRVGIYKPSNYDSDKIRLDNRTVSLQSLLTESQAEKSVEILLEQNQDSRANKLSDIADIFIEPNIILNEKLTSDELLQAKNAVTKQEGIITQGELLIAKGDIIDKNKYEKIQAYNNNQPTALFSKGVNIVSFLGYLLLTCLIIGSLLMYLKVHYTEIYYKLSTLAFILLWPLLFSLLVYLIEHTSSLSSYIIPFCIVPIIIKNFYTDRLALFVHIVIVLIASFLSSLGYEFTFLQILAGIVTVLFVSETRYWNKFFTAILIIFGTYMLGYLGLSLIQMEDNPNIEWSNFIYLAFSALLTLMAYPFIPLLERIFGFTSSISLVELSDMNKPLLKRLSMEAPGTLQHSLRVSNLSEAAADSIGANSLLIKVGALYHDIGKLHKPEYFIENQTGSNPHGQLNNFESAKVIIDHVAEGEKLAKKEKLPQVIIDFINTHHGTTRTEYFYRNQMKEFPDKEFDEILFRYPGPKPTTKEQGIMMMADSLEAASKSIQNPTGQDIDNLVEKIIAGKIQNGQLDLCELTLKELEECKTVFSSMLRSMNHVRIEYPEEVKSNP